MIITNETFDFRRYCAQTQPSRKIGIKTIAKLIMSLCFSNFYLIAPSVADPQAGSKLFEGKCVGCHTVGKGVLVGPDLAGTKDWPDDKLQAAVKGMEKTVGPLSPDEVNNLVDYLKHSDSSASSKTSEASSSTDNSKTSADTKTSTDTSTASANTDNSSKNEQPKEDEAIVIGSALEGEMLFDGRKSFVNGGMSCNACHSVEGNGSGLGPDLTNISEKMNDKALLASCQQTPFKVMKAAYANHPVSKEEAANLVKYFDSIKGRQAHPEKFSVSLAGGAGSLIILLLVAVGYRNRNSGVRKKLHRR